MQHVSTLLANRDFADQLKWLNADAVSISSDVSKSLLDCTSMTNTFGAFVCMQEVSKARKKKLKALEVEEEEDELVKEVQKTLREEQRAKLEALAGNNGINV